jgi:hypothetical protein
MAIHTAIEYALENFFESIEEERFYGKDEVAPSVVKRELNDTLDGLGDAYEEWWLEGDEEWT